MFESVVKRLSNVLGAEEAALKLLLTVLCGYPLAIFYRKHIYGTEKHLSHLYFISTSFLLGYLNYGMDILHPFSSMVITYLLMVFLGGTSLMVAISFTFNLFYLLVGYHLMATESYDINWTMPHCVLILKLIGVSFDYCDGQQDKAKMSKDTLERNLAKRPDFLEFMGFCCFPASFMVGPQLPMRRYMSYIDGEFGDKSKPKEAPPSEAAAIQVLAVGAIYLVLFQILGFFVSDEMFLSDSFKESSFLWRHFLMGLWGKYTFYRYIFCWKLAEGACILFGITHNGKDENGEVLWNGLENINLWMIESATEFASFVHSFNINTNKWLAHYVYKRLRFLNNRNLSQLGALFFLAIWHGYHSGYFVCFFFEFIVIYMERDIKSIVASNDVLSEFFNREIVKSALRVLLWIYVFVFMGFCLIPFVLLTMRRYWEAFGAINYSGLILFAMYPIVWGPLLRMMLKKKKRD